MKSPQLFFLLLILSFFSCQRNEKPEKVIVAYVTSWKTTSLPDPTYITHINYAFGHVNNTFNGIRIDNEDRLRQIVALKDEKPTLKVLLSIGGWGSGGFSEMADDESKRKAFAKDCMQIIQKFNLDGVDIDWEYPTSDMAGISASPQDTNNFTLLMAEIRAAIGKKYLLTLATAANGKYIKYSAIKKYINFVNIMAYDIADPPQLHAPLFYSELTDTLTCATAISAHVSAGMPIERLVLGIPFYGRTCKELQEHRSYAKIKELSGYTRQWDPFAKAPYLTDEQGTVVCSYENEESIKHKCDYIHEMGLLGAMYWEYDNDDSEGTLRKAVYKGVMNDPTTTQAQK